MRRGPKGQRAIGPEKNTGRSKTKKESNTKLKNK